MKTNKVLISSMIVLTLMTPFLTFATEGTNSGGGGGGICVADRCFTLAEVGFKPSQSLPNQDELVIPKPPISEETFHEFETLVSTLVSTDVPFTPDIDLAENRLNDIFVPVESYDPRVIESLTNEYIRLLAEQNFPTQGFTLFAISNSSKTYLLPSFYKLNKRSQALVIIHENLMRKYWLMTEVYPQYQFITYREALRIIVDLDSSYLRIFSGDKSVAHKTYYPASRLFAPNTFESASSENYGSYTRLIHADMNLLGELRKQQYTIRIPMSVASHLNVSISDFKYFDFKASNASFADYKMFEAIKTDMPALWKILTEHGANVVKLELPNEYQTGVELAPLQKSFCANLSDGTYLTAKTTLAYGGQIASGIVSCKSGKQSRSTKYFSSLKRVKP